MNAETVTYLTTLVDKEIAYLTRVIPVEQHIADTTEVTSDAETAAERARDYREQLTRAEAAKAALSHPEHHQWCIRHGKAHADTGDKSCQWQENT